MELKTVQRFLVFWGLNTLVLWVASRIMPGIAFSGPEAILIGGLAFGLLNTFLKPVLFVLTLPITFLTLGLFVLVLNTAILFLVAWLVPGFEVGTFWQAFFAALFISVFSFLLNLLLRQ
jgi:putative membrane protein